MIPLPPHVLAIDMAINDPDTGQFDRKIRAIQISQPGELIEIEPQTWPGYTVTLTAAGVRLHRKVFAYVEQKYGVGNWCWDRFTFDLAERDHLLPHLRDCGHWRCTHAPAEFFDWFNRYKDDGHG